MGASNKLTRVAAFVGCVVAGAVVSATTAVAPHRIFLESESGNLKALVEDSEDWCKPEVQVSIYGADEALFKENRVELQRLLGFVRAGMAVDCPKAAAIVLNGFVDDVFLYRGRAAKDGAAGDWVLVEMPASLVANPPEPLPGEPIAKKAPDPSSIASCDRLAAHPDDPKKPKGVAGVTDDDIHAGEATAACEQALELEPDNPRLRFQLARAYLVNDKSAEGVTLMTEAAEEGHAAAIAALGDISLYGLIDDEPDPETGKALYQRAAKGGFKPADAYAKAIVANPKEATAAEAPPEYIRDEWVKAISVTGLNTVRTNDQFLAYALSFMVGVKHQCPDTGLPIGEQDIYRKIQSSLGGLGTLVFLSGYGEGGYDNLKQDAMDDGYALAVTSGCGANPVKAARQNLTQFWRS